MAERLEECRNPLMSVEQDWLGERTRAFLWGGAGSLSFEYLGIALYQSVDGRQALQGPASIPSRETAENGANHVP